MTIRPSNSNLESIQKLDEMVEQKAARAEFFKKMEMTNVEFQEKHLKELSELEDVIDDYEYNELLIKEFPKRKDLKERQIYLKQLIEKNKKLKSIKKIDKEIDKKIKDQRNRLFLNESIKSLEYNQKNRATETENLDLMIEEKRKQNTQNTKISFDVIKNKIDGIFQNNLNKTEKEAMVRDLLPEIYQSKTPELYYLQIIDLAVNNNSLESLKLMTNEYRDLSGEYELPSDFISYVERASSTDMIYELHIIASKANTKKSTLSNLKDFKNKEKLELFLSNPLHFNTSNKPDPYIYMEFIKKIMHDEPYKYHPFQKDQLGKTAIYKAIKEGDFYRIQTYLKHPNFIALFYSVAYSKDPMENPMLQAIQQNDISTIIQISKMFPSLFFDMTYIDMIYKMNPSPQLLDLFVQLNPILKTQCILNDPFPTASSLNILSRDVNLIYNQKKTSVR